jgi:hypothetical protein
MTTEERLKTPFKWSEVDDTGEITAAAGGLRFTGRKKGLLVLSVIRAVSLVGPWVPWPTVLAMLVAGGLAFLLAGVGFFRVFTLHNPMTYVLVPLVAGLVVWVTPWTWVEVEYLDGEGMVRRVYFADGTPHGRLLGSGIRALYERLKDVGREGR